MASDAVAVSPRPESAVLTPSLSTPYIHLLVPSRQAAGLPTVVRSRLELQPRAPSSSSDTSGPSCQQRPGSGPENFLRRRPSASSRLIHPPWPKPVRSEAGDGAPFPSITILALRRPAHRHHDCGPARPKWYRLGSTS